MSRSLMIVAGEISGDMHAAPVLRALRARDPALTAWGIGGERLREAGMETLYGVEDMAVMGLGEVIRRYGFFRRVFRETIAEAERRKPSAVLLIDYPGFNLRFARQMKKRGITVFYYICPQVWAWHRSRIRRMARWIDRLFVIFPFEKDVFAGTGLRVDFVGHPLARAADELAGRPEEALPWTAGPRFALLPGSRRQEIERILPAMIGAADRLADDLHPDALIAAPDRGAADCARAVLNGAGRPDWIDRVVTGKTRSVLRQARAALVASGTATLEAAMMGCPMAVVYKTSWPTYWAARMLICVDHIGMVNIVAGRTVCPEFIQHAARPEALAEAARKLIPDTPERRTMVEELARIKEALGSDDPAERVAEGMIEGLRSPD